MSLPDEATSSGSRESRVAKALGMGTNEKPFFFSANVKWVDRLGLRQRVGGLWSVYGFCLDPWRTGPILSRMLSIFGRREIYRYSGPQFSESEKVICWSSMSPGR